MKELLGHASNLFLVPTGEGEKAGLSARLELVIVCREPSYEYSMIDGIRGRSEVCSFRVLCSHKALREMARQLLELADDAENLEARANLAPE